MPPRSRAQRWAAQHVPLLAERPVNPGAAQHGSSISRPPNRSLVVCPVRSRLRDPTASAPPQPGIRYQTLTSVIAQLPRARSCAASAEPHLPLGNPPTGSAACQVSTRDNLKRSPLTQGLADWMSGSSEWERGCPQPVSRPNKALWLCIYLSLPLSEVGSGRQAESLGALSGNQSTADLSRVQGGPEASHADAANVMNTVSRYACLAASARRVCELAATGLQCLISRGTHPVQVERPFCGDQELRVSAPRQHLTARSVSRGLAVQPGPAAGSQL